MTARALFGVIAGALTLAILGAVYWWRRHPSACPYSQRFTLAHPVITRKRLHSVLRPEPGERLLEIGPGTGYYTLDMAEWIGPEGRVEILDIQQEFLNHTIERARKRGLQNIHPNRGDAARLPFENGSIDAVVLIAVLGEIPEGDVALQEIHRVLRPHGRLVVGELFGDPHFTTMGAVRRRCTAAGMGFEERSVNWFAYFALFRVERATGGAASS